MLKMAETVLKKAETHAINVKSCNPLLDNRILDASKLKEFADDNFNRESNGANYLWKAKKKLWE